MQEINAQILYTDFVEQFRVSVDQDNIDLKLKSILPSTDIQSDVYTLNLSGNIKEAYSAFPFENGDLTIIQVKDTFVIAVFGDQVCWYKIPFKEILDYLFEVDIISSISSYINEDREVLLNSVLSDLIRNDYSYSDFNKRIKYAKLSIVLSFLNTHLSPQYSRIILDETFLGDIEISEITTALRFSSHKFLKGLKINNVFKILSLLEREKVIDKHVGFVEDVYFVNKIEARDKVKLIFSTEGKKIDYEVLEGRNYFFELDHNKIYSMNVANLFKEDVCGKVFVFNGDERDLLIN